MQNLNRVTAPSTEAFVEKTRRGSMEQHRWIGSLHEYMKPDAFGKICAAIATGLKIGGDRIAVQIKEIVFIDEDLNAQEPVQVAAADDDEVIQAPWHPEQEEAELWQLEYDEAGYAHIAAEMAEHMGMLYMHILQKGGAGACFRREDIGNWYLENRDKGNKVQIGIEGGPKREYTIEESLTYAAAINVVASVMKVDEIRAFEDKLDRRLVEGRKR